MLPFCCFETELLVDGQRDGKRESERVHQFQNVRRVTNGATWDDILTSCLGVPRDGKPTLRESVRLGGACLNKKFANRCLVCRRLFLWREHWIPFSQTPTCSALHLRRCLFWHKPRWRWSTMELVSQWNDTKLLSLACLSRYRRESRSPKPPVVWASVFLHSRRHHKGASMGGLTGSRPFLDVRARNFPSPPLTPPPLIICLFHASTAYSCGHKGMPEEPASIDGRGQRDWRCLGQLGQQSNHAARLRMEKSVEPTDL